MFPKSRLFPNFLMYPMNLSYHLFPNFLMYPMNLSYHSYHYCPKSHLFLMNH
jgi:hypothetical protein